MSLFDVIRYPVNDIFSDEINSYPREIMVPWLNECYTIAGQDVDIFDTKECKSFSTFVHMLIIRADMELDNNHERVRNTLKEWFTINLRNRIRNHE
jgi:hypothetical protein